MRMAIVTGNDTGGVILRFIGENTPSEKRYRRIKSYQPQAGDRVLLAQVGATYVILGAIDETQIESGVNAIGSSNDPAIAGL